MNRKLALALMAATLPIAAPAMAGEPAADAKIPAMPKSDRIPDQLDAGQREGYRAVFQAIREARWQDAQIGLDTMKPGPLHAIARAELYTAKGSPRIEMEPLVTLLNEAPELPEASDLARLAKARGAADLPPLPAAQRLVWQDGAPRRIRAASVRSDLIAADLATKMQPFVKADDGRSAQALLEETEGLTPEALTEWQAKVAWMYFLTGDDANARAIGAKAATGAGDWAIQGRWTGALAAWRQHDCGSSETAFEGVAARAGDVDLRAAGMYWAARADMACGRPDKVQGRLQAAAQYRESFYGQLARQALGVADKTGPDPRPRRRRLGRVGQAAQRPRRRRAGRGGGDRPCRRRRAPAGQDRRAGRVRQPGPSRRGAEPARDHRLARA